MPASHSTPEKTFGMHDISTALEPMQTCRAPETGEHGWTTLKRKMNNPWNTETVKKKEPGQTPWAPGPKKTSSNWSNRWHQGTGSSNRTAYDVSPSISSRKSYYTNRNSPNSPHQQTCYAGPISVKIEIDPRALSWLGPQDWGKPNGPDH